MRQSRPKYTNKSRNLSYCLNRSVMTWIFKEYDFFIWPLSGIFLSSKSPFNVTPKLGYNSPLNSIWKSVTYQYWHFLCISYAKVESLKGPFISPFWYISSWRLFPYVCIIVRIKTLTQFRLMQSRIYGRVDLNASSIVADTGLKGNLKKCRDRIEEMLLS